MVREGIPFVLIPVLIAAVFGWFLIWPAAAFLALIAAFMLYFFRDPHREVPQEAGLIISAADGRVTRVDDNGNTKVVSVFLSPLDVHINRSPVAGRIARSIYVPGSFLNAALDKASEENERRGIVIATAGDSEIAVVQIAGLIARRIVTFVNEGDSVGVGERFGLIRFGSRVDVYLPPGRGSLVAVGQRAIGGETVLADLRSEEPEREARVQ